MVENKRFRLRRHYSVVAHSSDLVELRHGTWNAVSFTLADDSGSGALLRIMNRLDGQLSPAEIAAAEGVPEADVEGLIDQLARIGVVEEGSGHALDYYLDHVIPNLAPYGERGQTRFSGIVLLGDRCITEEIERVLRAGGAADFAVAHADAQLTAALERGARTWAQDGIAFAEEVETFDSWRDRLVVFGGATLNPLQLQALNRISLEYRFPWIQAVADGPFLLVGPTFLPWRSACYSCLDARVGMNLREGGSYQRYKRALAEGHASAVTAPLDAVLSSMLAAHTAFEALNFVLTGASFTVGKLLAIYLPTLEFTFNEVLRLPGCPACGPNPESDDRELYFELRTLLNGGASGNGTGER
jgi:bacteriocin biosynthesis cyclodehydratase domain-containing protein